VRNAATPINRALIQATIAEPTLGAMRWSPPSPKNQKIETFTEIVGTSAKNSFCSTFALAFRSLSRRSMAVETIAFHARAGLTPSRDPPVHPRYLVVARVFLLMRTGWLRQEEIDVCKRQCASRKQADGSRAAW
jgi:hypothetical protein